MVVTSLKARCCWMLQLFNLEAPQRLSHPSQHCSILTPVEQNSWREINNSFPGKGGLRKKKKIPAWIPSCFLKVRQWQMCTVELNSFSWAAFDFQPRRKPLKKPTLLLWIYQWSFASVTQFLHLYTEVDVLFLGTLQVHILQSPLVALSLHRGSE